MPEQLLHGPDGGVLASFRLVEVGGRPLAARFTLHARPEEVEAAVLRELRGWRIAAEPPFAERLLAAGGRPHRHAHLMSRDLRRDPAPAGWADPPAPPGYRLAPLDRPARDLAAACAAAYPPEHPDHEPAGKLESELEQLIDGSLLGPLLDCSGLAVDAADDVAGAVLVNGPPGDPPLDGPFISNVFRRPGAAGVGGALLRRSLGLATRAGLPGIGLFVTHANPARAVYAALGFAEVEERLTVELVR